MRAKIKLKKYSLKKTIKKCLYCGKKYKRYNRGSKFCSFKCYSLAVKGRSLSPYYQSGRRYEYKTMKELKKIGFQIVIRSARSGGIFDIYAIRGSNKTRRIEEVRCIQVKSTASSFPVKSIVPKAQRAEIINNKEVPIIGKDVFYEIWVWRIRKGKDIYRLNWKTKEFEKI